MSRALTALCAAMLTIPGVPLAEDLAEGLARCAGISDSLQRLVCYDALAKGSAGSATPPMRSSGSADASDPCAPNLKKEERLRRLAAFGTVRQISEETYEAGKHRVAFFADGSLLACK